MNDDIRAAREALRQVAVHIVARARSQSDGRFSLRVTPGGFGTPEFGPTHRRVRISGATMLVEDDAPGMSAALGLEMDGATLAELATAAGVDLSAALDVGHDTPPVGDVHAPLRVDRGAAWDLAAWFDRSAPGPTSAPVAGRTGTRRSAPCSLRVTYPMSTPRWRSSPKGCVASPSEFAGCGPRSA